MKKPVWIAAFALTMLVVAGCGSADSSVAVSDDGQAVLTVQLRVPKPDEGNPFGLAKPPEKIFVLPDPQVWKVERTTDKDGNVIITGTRNLPIGEDVDAGMTLLTEKGKVTRSTVRVDRSSNGWKYSVTVEWLGAPSQTGEEELDRGAQAILAALPPNTATLEEAREIARDVQQRVWRTLFGPPDPLLPQLPFSGQESMQRKLRARLFGAFEQALTLRLGSRLKPEQRKALVQAALLASDPSQEVSPKKAESSDNSPLVGLSFAVRLPGRVTLHNGLVDPVTGEVYWDLFPQAAQPGKVVLTAVSVLAD